MKTMATTTKAYAKLLRKLEREYDRATDAEGDAPTTELAWRLAAVSERCLRRLQAARAGLPLPEPKAPNTRRNRARWGFAALAQLGRVVARALQAKAALVKAQAASALARVARHAAKLARRALRSVVGAVARLALRARTAATVPTSSPGFKLGGVMAFRMATPMLQARSWL